MNNEVINHVEVLRQHNEWRRGAEIAPTEPRALGLAIHAVIEEIERLREIEKAAINCDVKGRHHSELAMNRLMEVCGKK